MVLSAKRDDEWQELWTVEFADQTHPAAIHVDNRGDVVTVGNTLPGTRDGRHALAIYRDGKAFRQFSRDDMLKTYGEPDRARFATGTRVVSIHPPWYRHAYACFDTDGRFCMWDDAARAWIVVDLTDGSLVKADEERRREYVEQVRKDAYARIAEKDREACYPYYYRLARFLHADDKPIFKELVTHPYSRHLASGYSSGPGDIFFFTANRYRELAEWALAAIEDGKQDAIADSRTLGRHEEYRHLGSLTFLATFEEPPTSDDGIVVLWLEPVGGTDDTEASNRPDHVMGVDLRYKIRKPLVMPVRMHLYGVTPGKYRVRGYWNKDIEQVYSIRDDFWKRTGQFTVADAQEVEVRKGKLVDVPLSFERRPTP